VAKRPGSNLELGIVMWGRPSSFLGFDHGQFKTDDGKSVAADRKDDNWSVFIGGVEHYFIPDALIFGG